MADWIEPGQKAPSFTLTADDGWKVCLADLEACAFRDLKAEFQELGAKVLGVSPDDVVSHGKFRDKYELNFPLLADPDHAVAEKYGAWREKNMYGKKSIGVQRSTYLIDRSGKVAQVWKRVQVDGHDEQVLAALKALDSKT
jgi:peroxiredoxin Q/BCP